MLAAQEEEDHRLSYHGDTLVSGIYHEYKLYKLYRQRLKCVILQILILNIKYNF